MSCPIIKAAEVVRGKYKYEIDGTVDMNAFFKAKFEKDKKDMAIICNNLYKKLKK